MLCSAWDDPEFVEAVLRLVLTRLVDSQLGVFAMLNFAISIYAVGALTTKVQRSSWERRTTLLHTLAVLLFVALLDSSVWLSNARSAAGLGGLFRFMQTIFLGNLTRLESSHMRERLLKFLAFKVVMVAAVWSAALEDSPFWLPM